MPSHTALHRSRTREVTSAAVALVLVLLLVPGAAAQTTVPSGEIDKLFGWVAPDGPGCAVAASHQGNVIVKRAYGLADLERPVRITPDTVFDAGSVVKQFVAAATLMLVEEGRLSLTEDIRKYLPELPDYGHTITLDHLMTHTSGIRDWTGLGPLTGRQVDALTLTLRQRGLNFAPGEEWSYSNGGYVLLKEIVARVGGMSFGDFARKRLFEPLGMQSTAYVADERTLIKNRALAYEKAGSAWRLDIQMGNERGGGGALFSTVSDLLLWNDALTNGRLGTFVTAKLQEPAVLKNGRKLGYARGLFLDANRGGRVIWHSGGAAGYSTMLVRFPEQGLSVATMCNAGESAEGDRYARRIFDLVVPQTAAASTTQKPNVDALPRGGTDARTEAVDVTANAGLFFRERDGQPLRLVTEKGRLRIAGGPPLEVIGKERFRNPRGALSVMSQDEFELHFVSADLIELKSMEGATTRYRRAQPFAPTPDDLRAFAGRYENDESRALFDISPGNRGLVVRVGWSDSQRIEFQPVDRDTFQFAGMFLRFRRDDAGRVVGLHYSNPVVRNIAFTRATEGSNAR